MARPKRPSPIEVFEQNLAGAKQLLQLAEALANYRAYRMRRELREAVGMALRYRKRDHDQLDCVESDEAFLIIKPESNLTRDAFTEEALRPLLRQAVVAIAAAVETYVAERACELVGEALRADPQPRRLRQLAVSMGDVIDIEAGYKRRGWGYGQLVRDHLRQEASASSNQIGTVLSTVGVDKLWSKVDGERRVRKGTSAGQLDELAERRNNIAHSADWNGSRRAALSLEDAERFLANAYETVEAIERVVA